jgi:hypothetical protein
MESIYQLKPPRSNWGDYDYILLGGMTHHVGRSDGLLQLERTGPFVPPISFPGMGDIIVTDDFKKSLESSRLIGLTFQPVIKRHIVFLEWEKWDKTADEPAEYPESGEPEDYILERPHSPELAQQIGEMWELCLPEYAKLKEAQSDLFRRKGQLYNFVSNRAKRWLEKTVSEWVSFELAQTEK